MAGKRLIVTGAGGFLGTKICMTICQRNIYEEVIAITLGADDMRSRFSGFDAIDIFSEDALNTEEVVLRKEDILLNCAYPRAMKGVDVTIGLDYVESVFRAAAAAKIRGIINISSQSVYDPQRDYPATEEDIPCLTDMYSVGKYCMEILLRNICKEIFYTNIRLASLIGPGFDVRVPNKMVKYALETGQINVEVNHQKFGYLDVEDAVNGLLGLLQMDPKEWRTLYNLGSKQTYSLLELAETIRGEIDALRGKNITIEKYEGKAVFNSALDSTRLKTDIGEYQKNDLKNSIYKIIKEFKS